MFLAVSCTIGEMTEQNRKRLAEAVIARRVELGMNTTTALAERADLSSRTLGDVENGRRDNFSPGARAQIERALGWGTGSIKSILNGGDPIPVTEVSQTILDTFRLSTQIAELKRQRQREGSHWSETDEEQLHTVERRVDASKAELKRNLTSAVQNSRALASGELLDLWLLARPFDHPSLLQPEELMDNAVSLARAVSTFTERRMGGFSRAQDLAQQRADDLARQEGQVDIFHGMQHEAQVDRAPTQEELDLAAARALKLGEEFTQPEQGTAGGEGSQIDPDDDPNTGL